MDPVRLFAIATVTLALTAAAPPARAATPEIRYMLSQQQSAKVITYERAVLDLLLEKTVASHGPYRLQASQAMTQSRTFRRLADGELDLTTSMTSSAREAAAIPVRVCLYRGLLGVRLPIAASARRGGLDSVEQVAQLRTLNLGQVADWPDTAVLQGNGMRVLGLNRLEIFPEMLRRERIDLFALGAIEAYPIVDALAGVAVLEHWLIAYPSAFYFFVSPAKPELAQRLRKGWELALADGSFEALFEQWAGAQLQRARLSERRWMVLRNPDLPQATPLQDERLWHPLVRSRLFNATPVRP